MPPRKKSQNQEQQEEQIEKKQNKADLLRATIQEINKTYGEGTLSELSHKANLQVETISTGIPEVDFASGVMGIPRGRIIEVFGPESSGKTSLTLSIIAQTQKMNGVAAFIDAEHALDPAWARKLGVNTDLLLVSQPDNGEQALDVVLKLAKSGTVDVIVVDSVAALVPTKEIEGEIGDHHVAAQARMMSSALKLLTAEVSKSKCVIIFINQIRMKIGVLFGCFHKNTPVHLLDGSTKEIGSIVDSLRHELIWSYDIEKKRFVSSTVLQWHNNGQLPSNETFWSVSVRDSNSALFDFLATKNHKVYVQSKGWKEVQELVAGDSLLSFRNLKSILSNTVPEPIQILLAILMISSFSPESTLFPSTFNIFVVNLEKQRLSFVKNLLSTFSKYFSVTEKTQPILTTFEVEVIDQQFSNYLTFLSVQLLNNLQYITPNRAPLTWAIINTLKVNKIVSNRQEPTVFLSFPNNAVTRSIYDMLVSHYPENLNVTTIADNKGHYSIQMPLSAYHVIESAAKQYNLDSYKIPDITDSNFVFPTLQVDTVKQINREAMSDPDLMRYDLAIAEYENYFVGSDEYGVLVHNSPETTTGGNALKFYSSMRIEVRKIETISKSNKMVGNKIKVKFVKNKVAPPFTHAEIILDFENGFSELDGLVSVAETIGVLKRNGAWYYYKNEKLEHGKVLTVAFLEKNPEMVKSIKSEIEEYVKNKSANAISLIEQTADEEDESTPDE